MSTVGEKPLRILLVEDHPDQAELTRRTVERQLQGAEVTVADRGEACLKRLADASYDLLLLDYSLPDMSGLELLREVKTRGYRLPVVIVTGQGDERIAVEAMKGGAADYIIKTGGYLTTLPAVIQKVLQQAELQKTLAAAQAEVLQRNRELTDLHTLASTLSGSLHLGDLLPLALDVILASVEGECGGIYLYSPDGGDLILANHRCLSAAVRERFPERVSVGEGLIGAASLDGKAVFLDDPSHPDLAGAGLTRLAIVPFAAKGRQTGILFVGCTRTGSPSPERRRLLEMMGNQVGVAVENAQLYQRAENRAKELVALNEVGRQLTATWRLEDLLPRIADSAAKLLRVEAAGFRLLEGDELVIAGMAGEAGGLMSAAPRLKMEESVSGQAILERRPVRLTDLETAPDCFASLKARARTMGFSSALAAPLGSGDRAIGALCVFSKARREFTQEEVLLLSALADQAAIAVENARLFAESESRRRVAEALAEVGRVLSQTLDPDVVAQRIVNGLSGLLRCRLSALYRLDPESGNLAGVVVSSEAERAFGGEPVFPRGTGVCGLAVLKREPVVTPNLLTDPRITLTPELRRRIERAQYHAALSVPLIVRGEVIGALAVGDQEGRVFGAEEIKLAQTFADQAALALESARLYRETAQAYEELQRTQGKLIQAEKLRALGEMAGGVAHDFNNLLAIILGRAQYLALRQGDLPPDDVKRSLGIIERAALDGADTVRRLMNFTRATPRQQEAEAVDPDEILDYVADASRPRWKDEVEAKGKQIQVNIERGNAPLVTGNAAELREVMLNLVFNAIEAMPEGGCLTLKSWTEGSSVCLAVQDTGVGMPEEVARKIFDPFFTTKGPQRSGLGLSVSYGIVRRHQGEITVESGPGKGTTFTIRLPVGSAPTHQLQAPPEPLRSRLRILVVDDDDEVREILLDILQNAGHTVLEARGGAEALEILEREGVDLVCTDLGMPGMSGWEVADRVKNLWPALKVALITGWGAQVESKDLESHGVDLLIAKPFQVKEILQSLDGIYAGNGTHG